MRVRKSAIGSVIDIALDLPARLLDARDQALVSDLAQADAAEPELAEVRARATAPLAAVREREAECVEQGIALLIGLRRRREDDVEAANLVDGVVVDLREDDLL